MMYDDSDPLRQVQEQLKSSLHPSLSPTCPTKDTTFFLYPLTTTDKCQSLLLVLLVSYIVTPNSTFSDVVSLFKGLVMTYWLYCDATLLIHCIFKSVMWFEQVVYMGNSVYIQ